MLECRSYSSSQRGYSCRTQWICRTVMIGLKIGNTTGLHSVLSLKNLEAVKISNVKVPPILLFLRSFFVHYHNI